MEYKCDDPEFNEIKILSNTEVAENLLKTEKELFNLRFISLCIDGSYNIIFLP